MRGLTRKIPPETLLLSSADLTMPEEGQGLIRCQKIGEVWVLGEALNYQVSF